MLKTRSNETEDFALDPRVPDSPMADRATLTATKMVSTMQSLRFRIELQGITPTIWREIDVPSSCSFWDLHVAIQDAMGWLDYHLHAFRVQDPNTGQVVEIGIPYEELFEDSVQALPGWETPVLSYLKEPGQSAGYEYAFGDSWNHQIILKEIVPCQKGTSYPLCVGGERACPPEDCGGIWGYGALLEIINDPAHEEHEEMLEWLGGQFDPEQFDSAMVKFDDPKKRWKIAFEEED